MASVRSPFGARVELVEADSLDRQDRTTASLDLTGAAGCVILVCNDGTDGTAGIDVIEASTDGVEWLPAIAANFGRGYTGLLDEDGVAVEDAILNAADEEPTNGAASFTLAPPAGPFFVRVGSETDSEDAVDWVDGAPSIDAIRIG